MFWPCVSHTFMTLVDLSKSESGSEEPAEKLVMVGRVESLD